MKSLSSLLLVLAISLAGWGTAFSDEPSDTAPPAVQAPAEELPSLESMELPALVGRVILFLGILIGVGALALYLTRRGKLFTISGSSKKNLKVEESHMLGNKQFLMVVSHKSKRVLLGVGPGMIKKICDLDSPQKDDIKES